MLNRLTFSEANAAYTKDVLIKNILLRAKPLWSNDKYENRYHFIIEKLKLKDHQVEHWKNILGSQDLLDRRLNNDKVTFPNIIELLENYKNGKNIECWEQTFSSILEFYSPFSSFVKEHHYLTDRSFDLNYPLPFQEIMVGFVEYARSQLAGKANESVDILSARAKINLEQNLLSHLTFLSGLAFGQDFFEYRFIKEPLSVLGSTWQKGKRTTKTYLAYVRYMNEGGILFFFDKYAVLARLLSLAVEQWINSVINFCERFFNDFEEINKLFEFGLNNPQGSISHLQPEMSDRHHQGQTVYKCKLVTDRQIIYKPRTVKPEVAFNKFIEWLNNCELSLDLKVIRALDKGNHGWVEFISSENCHCELDIMKFYKRAGILLGVLHVLAITDIHFENLIAQGEHPVIVDLETLLDEAVEELPRRSNQISGGTKFSKKTSVIRTGMLPRYQKAPDGHLFDMSALGADESQDSGVKVLKWESVNTDQMTLTEDKRTGVLMKHRVQIEGRSPALNDYLPSFLSGFRELYSCIINKRRKLVTNDFLLRHFDNLELRSLIRNTNTYTYLQLRTLHPEFLKNGIDRSIELEWLARPLTAPNLPQNLRLLVYEFERMAIENLDVPHFRTSDFKGIRIEDDDYDIFHLLTERSSKTLIKRLSKLSMEDCLTQLEIIKKAVFLRFQ